MDIEYLKRKAIEAALYAGEKIMKVYEEGIATIELKNDNSPLTLADKKSHNRISNILKVTNIPVLSEEGKNIPYEQRKTWEVLWIIDPLDGTKEFINRNGEFTVNIALIKNQKPVLGVIYVPVCKMLYYSDIINGAYKKCETDVTVSDQKKLSDSLAESVKLPIKEKRKTFIIVGSRSHMNKETQEYIEILKKKHDQVEIVSRGSSLKMCMVAEGRADIYPRFGPTMEWDTAAGHCIALGAGLEVVQQDGVTPLVYNKEILLNPWFIVKHKKD